MAILIKHLFITLLLVISVPSIGHSVFAPSDIPLLDNRFRIDPKTDKITFVLNHSKGPQRVILVQPDGHKLYRQRHPDTVAWVSGDVETIITIDNPMAGPWQALAELDGDNRIKLISKVHLEVGNLPLKLYAQEYITTQATLYEGDRILTDPAYLNDAKLSIAIIGNGYRKVSLYRDNGQNYDQLAFDGNLTTHIFIDILPGRYLLNIKTKNNVFLRNVNKDAVIFPTPVHYDISPQDSQAKLIFSFDQDEIVKDSVVIKGIIRDAKNAAVREVLVHSVDSMTGENAFTQSYELPFQMYSFSGKAYATTLSGREIELQLATKIFHLIPPFNPEDEEEEESAALSPEMQAAADEEALKIKEAKEAEAVKKVWIFLFISAILILLLLLVAFLVLKKKSSIPIDENDIDELDLKELQPAAIDIKDAK